MVFVFLSGLLHLVWSSLSILLQVALFHSFLWLSNSWDSLVAQMVKRLPATRETGFNLWVGKIPWRRKWQSTPVLMPGKFHGWRSLMGYSPWGHKESDTTERLHFTNSCYQVKFTNNFSICLITSQWDLEYALEWENVWSSWAIMH